MGWLIEALANVFLELLGDMMSWTVNLVTNLSLDIGMPSRSAGMSGSPGGAVSSDTVVPALGTLIDPLAARHNLLESLFPAAASFTVLFMALAYAIILFMTITKLMIAMGGPFTRSEEPGTIVIRSLIAVVGTTYSFSIFVLMESLFNTIYGYFMTKYKALTEGVENYSLLMDETTRSGTSSAVEQYSTGGAIGSASDAFSMFKKDLIGDYQWGEGVAVTIIAIILFTILLVSYLKLVLEIYERYVMLGVLFFTAPLAFSTIVSKQMNVFGSWVQMVISEFVVMCSNLFFTGVFIHAWHTILSRRECLFKTPQQFITEMFIMISWLIIGQQFDQHLKGLGLSTAQTGQGLGGAVMAGVGSAAVAAHMAGSAISTGARFATGATPTQRAMSNDSPLKNPMKTFERSNELRNGADATKSEGKRMLDDLDHKTHGATGFNSTTPSLSTKEAQAEGAKARQALEGILGKEGFNKALQAQGVNPSQLQSSYYGLDGKGVYTAYGSNGKKAMIQDASRTPEPMTQKTIEGSIGTPLTRDEATTFAGDYATKLNSHDPTIDGRRVQWQATETDAGDISLAAYEMDKKGNILKDINGNYREPLRIKSDIPGLQQTGRYLDGQLPTA